MSSSPRKHVAWDSKQRWVLVLVWETIEEDNQLRLSVFEHVVRQHINPAYVGRPLSALRCQYSESTWAAPKACWNGIARSSRSTEGDEVMSQWQKKIDLAKRLLSTSSHDDESAEATPIHTPKTPRKRPSVEAEDSENDTPQRKATRLCNDWAVLKSTSKAVKGPKSPRTPQNKTHALPRSRGGGVMTTKEKAEIALSPPVQITEELAHPHPPPLLFRHWSPKSRGRNSTSGFLAERFIRSNIPAGEPAKCDQLEWADLEYHIDGVGFDSPFISTSMSLAWTLRRAVKELSKSDIGDEEDDYGYISIIDTRKLKYRSFFYAPPFVNVLIKHFALTEGHWMYRGIHEFLVWREIPEEAIISTQSVHHIVRRYNESRTLQKMLRFNTWSKGDKDKARKALALDQIGLTAAVARTMADVFLMLGIRHAQDQVTLPEQVSYLVSDFIYGWAVQTPGTTHEEWAKLATAFVTQLSRALFQSPDMREQTRLKAAFLDGVKWSKACSTPRFMPGRSAKAERHAKKIGITSVSEVLLKELDSIKRFVLSTTQPHDIEISMR